MPFSCALIFYGRTAIYLTNGFLIVCRDSAIAVLDRSQQEHKRATKQQYDNVFFFEPYQG